MMVRRFVNSIFESNTYVLWPDTGRSAWAIDPGDAEPVVRFLEEQGRTLEGILLTHSHHDHIYGVNELQDRCGRALIYASREAVAGLYSPKLNMSRYYLQPYEVRVQDIQCVSEGTVIPLGRDTGARVLETPGHHPSCLTFAVGDDLFTGDSLIPEVKVVTILPGGDKALARQSIERLFREFGAQTRVRPGHGDDRPLGSFTPESCLVL